jgi:3-hydroxyacyl-[acyl-carrier-protein] dehydratase
MMAVPRKMDIEAIMHLLPHRYPLLLVDRVLDVQAGQYVRAIKNVTFNEPFFTGHFPHRPVMPGVMIIEALAQACGILAFHTVEVVPDSDTRFYFVAIDNARFRRPVEPGDQILLKAQLKRSLKGIWKFDCLAEVDGAEVASAEIMVAPETKAPAVKAPPAKAQKPKDEDKAGDEPEGTGAVG